MFEYFIFPSFINYTERRQLMESRWNRIIWRCRQISPGLVWYCTRTDMILHQDWCDITPGLLIWIWRYENRKAENDLPTLITLQKTDQTESLHLVYFDDQLLVLLILAVSIHFIFCQKNWTKVVLYFYVSIFIIIII